MSPLESQVELFIKQACPMDTAHVQNKILDFFGPADSGHRHIICKNGVLYLFDGVQLMEAVALEKSNSEPTVVSFDGRKVSRTSPEFYFGKGALNHNTGVQDDFAHDAFLGNVMSDIMSDIVSDIAESNNNNNNNNNNGNNNG